ncbi:MAG: thiamine pyrophosphate-binding protein [Opitutaceae bacterium]
MIKLSDYVMDFLAKRGIDTVFTVSGGGIMHLLDSLGRNTELKYYCNYHEQASAIAAEGYARITSKPAVVLVTVGPGAVNAISGMVGAWYDGLPMLVITGQVRRDLIADYSEIRQFGPQEGNTVGMAATVSKYAKVVMDPNTIRYELEKALHLATSGRPGPVLLDIPLDVQGAQIDETALPAYNPEEARTWDPSTLEQSVRNTIELLKQAKRPVLMGGTGIRVGLAYEAFLRVAEALDIPIVVPFSAKDLVPEDHPLNMGVFGTAGQRRANFAIQNSDLILSCATGLSLTKVGFNYKGFAPKARKVIVDVDEGQIHQHVIKPDLAIHADAKAYLDALLVAADGQGLAWSPKWLPACRQWREKYPIIVDDFRKDRGFVNSYLFVDTLADLLPPGQAVVPGNGLDVVSFYQAFKIKEGQRALYSSNWGSMGWGLPLAIGVCIANQRRRTICLTGDGSLQWNIQELLFLQYHKLPVAILIFNNDGYQSIRGTQDAFFEGRYTGADSSSGVANPNFEKLAGAYGMPYFKIARNDEIAKVLPAVLAVDGPVLCEVMIEPGQGISPKASAFKRPDGTLESRPLEDMAPFLPREEVYANMHLFDDE